jgi:hypothetical protein
MNQNPVLVHRKPTYFERMSVYLLVGKIIVDQDGVFSLEEIEFAAGVSKSVEFPNRTIQEFLDVVAGANPNDSVYHECYAALTFPYEENDAGEA